jgi:hypothetical protein
LPILRSAGISLLIPVCLAMPRVGNAQTPVTGTVREETNVGPVDLAHAIYLVGLPDVEARSNGDLSLSFDALEFGSGELHADIPLKQITAVNIGNERTEKGGTAGQVARRVIPFGGEPALAVASQKWVDLLTVEYRDSDQGYHGAVFVLPTNQALGLRQKILAKVTAPQSMAATACSDAPQLAASVLVAPIEVSDVDLPAQYRVLLYEHLITELQLRRPSNTYLRAGDASSDPRCTTLTLYVTVNGFKKGNQVLRASTGPLGKFLGTTSISSHVTLDNQYGKTVFDSQLKKSNRRDSDSLNLADSIAKAISKKTDKAISKNQPGAQVL